METLIINHAKTKTDTNLSLFMVTLIRNNETVPVFVEQY